MKMCSICHVEKQDTEFGTYLYKDIIKQKTHCKSCFRKIRRQSWIKHRHKHLNRSKIYRQENIEKFRSYQQKWYHKNRQGEIKRSTIYRSTWDGKISQWKCGAKRRKIQWNISDSFLKQLPMICYYSGLALSMEIGQLNTLSIDRIDSSKPYTEDNIVPCCSVINMMKGELSKSDFLTMCEQINAHILQQKMALHVGLAPT